MGDWEYLDWGAQSHKRLTKGKVQVRIRPKMMAMVETGMVEGDSLEMGLATETEIGATHMVVEEVLRVQEEVDGVVRDGGGISVF